VDPAIEVARLRPGVDKLSGCLDQLMPAGARLRLDERIAELVAGGTPPELARAVCLLEPLTRTLGLVEAAEDSGADLTFLTAIFGCVGEELQIDWLRDQAAERDTDDHWSILARVAVGDDLVAEQQRLSLAILRDAGTASSPEEAVANWLESRQRRLAVFEHTPSSCGLRPRSTCRCWRSPARDCAASRGSPPGQTPVSDESRVVTGPKFAFRPTVGNQRAH